MFKTIVLIKWFKMVTIAPINNQTHHNENFLFLNFLIFYSPVHTLRGFWCPAGGNSADAPSWKAFIQISLIDQSYSLIAVQRYHYEIYKQLNGKETSWQDISPAQSSFCPPRAQYIKIKTIQEITVDLNDCIRNLVTSTHPVLLHSQKAKKEVAVRSAVVDVTLQVNASSDKVKIPQLNDFFISNSRFCFFFSQNLRLEPAAQLDQTWCSNLRRSFSIWRLGKNQDVWAGQTNAHLLSLSEFLLRKLL